MRTMNNLPNVPPHEMERYMKDMQAVDAQSNQEQNNAPDDIINQLKPVEEQPAQAEEPREEVDHRQNNMIRLREAKEAAEREKDRIARERDEYAQRMRELEQKYSSSQQASPQEEQELQLAPDALAEGKHLSSIYKKMRQMEERIQQYERQTQQDIVESRLKAQYPDFDSVVCKDNLDELRRAHPSIAQAIATAATQDAYSAASSAYTIIKEMGLAKSSQEMNMTRRMIQENATKPRSAQSASPQRGNTPLSKANEYMYDGRMTNEYQEQLLKEMHEARMRRG